MLEFTLHVALLVPFANNVALVVLSLTAAETERYFRDTAGVEIYRQRQQRQALFLDFVREALDFPLV